MTAEKSVVRKDSISVCQKRHHILLGDHCTIPASISNRKRGLFETKSATKSGAQALAVIPAATVSAVPAATITQILNSGALDITKKTLCLKKNQQFNVVSGQGQYDLNSILGDFLIPDKSGLWWNNGTEFTQVYSRTLKELDNEYPNWRSLSPGNPQFYSIDENILTTVFTPNTSLANGFWLYYTPMSTDMVNSGDFPFVGSANEIKRLRIFDESLEAYCRWKISPMLSKDGQDQTQIIYKATLDDAKALFEQRPDIFSEAKMRVSNVC